MDHFWHFYQLLSTQNVNVALLAMLNETFFCDFQTPCDVTYVSLIFDMFSCTRDDRKERIVAAGNSVRQALQELLSEYIDNAGKKPSEQLDDAIQNMLSRTRGLRKQLRKAVVDHVSDSFLEPDNPLLLLMTAAKEGREKEVEEFGAIFTEHALKLIEVANLACSMSNNEDGVKMVRYAASQIENLCPQVNLYNKSST